MGTVRLLEAQLLSLPESAKSLKMGSPVGQGNDPNGTFHLLSAQSISHHSLQKVLHQFGTKNDDKVVESQTLVIV